MTPVGAFDTMTSDPKKRKFGWKLVLAFALVAIVVVSLALALVYVIGSGQVDRWARRAIVEQLEKTTGARVELGKFHFSWRPMRARLDNLTLHGREPAGTPPLFHAEQLQIELRLESFWGRKISLGSVEMSHFAAHIRVEGDGSTNIPGPQMPAGPVKKTMQELFDLKIARLRLDDGEVLWNDTRVPLVAEGGTFEFGMEYATETAGPVYLGRMSWQKFTLAAQRYLPFASDLSARFTLRPDSFSLTQLQWKIPHSEIDAQAILGSFSQPTWSVRYRGQLDFQDIRSILREPDMPPGHVEFTGDGRYAGQEMSVTGRYTADQIVMKYNWFHPGSISSRGSYQADERTLDIPDLEALLLGGKVTGRLHVDIPTQSFRAETKARGFELSRMTASEDNSDLPIIPLHWESRADIDATTTWTGGFKHLDSRGLMLWAPTSALQTGQIPASARVEFHVERDRRQASFAPSEITTPSSRIQFHGALGLDNCSLDTTVDTENLLLFDDFINRIRGEDAEPQVISGRFHWQGRLTGPLGGPTFTGHAKGTDARYGALYWDELETELTYSPEELRLARGRVRRGRSSAGLELSLVLDDWSFSPNSKWALDVSLAGAEADDLQKMLGTSYPAHGLLSGQFHGRGTRASPEFSGLFDISNATAWMWRFDRARGQLTVRNGEVRIANAEVRLPAHAAGAPAGLLTGNFLYRTNTHDVSFDLTGAGIPLEAIKQIQSTSYPLGGLLNLKLRGQGPLLAPELHATIRLIDLKVGADVIGSFEGTADSDGHHLTTQFESALATGKLSGKLDMTLGGEYPLVGEVTGEQIPFDTVLVSAMHLTGLTGHSRVDGHFSIAGFGARPDTLAIEANLSRITFDYEDVKLENVGPVRLTYRRGEVRIEQASLRGTDTDFRVTGFARFAGDRALNLRVDGAVSLQILAGYVPRLEATGRAQVNATVAGTLSAPRFNGRVHIEGTTLRYGDFPSGLSNVAGDFNFNATRLMFENVSAESGGGHLTIGGTVNFGEGPLTYVLNARSDQVRIRYPIGMSWLVGGTLRLAGDAQMSTLSGRIVIDRLLMGEGFDLSSLMSSAKESVSTPTTTTPFLRNLQFDIQVDSSPDSHLEWTGARFQTDANLRVRGTWQHPILLGHIHLLSGEMRFRGNQYNISRGDINFANPFRLDPVFNVEATTKIRQYEVTLDFTGPASRLTLAYRSDPPMPSSDIIALLALGQTSQESAQRTATGQNSGLGAYALLSEAISGQLGGRIERLFGVSHFSVGPSVAVLNSPQQTSIASVTIEQQVTPSLVITYITDVTTTQYQVIQVEYTINREFSVVALRDENGTFGLDVVRKTRFK
jgi:translocation and assembly module TamB